MTEPRTIRVDRLVAASDIARVLDVRYSAVSNWQRRPGVNFPAPIVAVANGTTPLWDVDEVIGWAADRAAADTERRQRRIEALRAEAERLEATLN